MSDSTTSISCGFAVQQVAVRLADCCMQLAVDLSWTCCATSCPTCCKTCCLFYNLLWTFVVDLLLAFYLLWICCTTCCTASCTTNPQHIEAVEHRVCHVTPICCGSVVQFVVTACCTTSQQQIEVMESDTNRPHNTHKRLCKPRGPLGSHNSNYRFATLRLAIGTCNLIIV